MAFTSDTFKKYRIGIVLHGNRIWISELLSIIFVIFLLCTLIPLSLFIFKNESLIRHNNNHLSELKVEKVIIDYRLESLKSKNRIASLLCKIASSRINDTTIYKLSELVYQNSNQFGYDPLLLLAVIKIESTFDVKAEGKFRSGKLSGAIGLMQLKFETAREVSKFLQIPDLQENDLFNPEINLILGAAYLTRLISRFKDFKLGILAYNQGPGAVRKQLKNKEPLSIKYYEKVLNSYYELQEMAKNESTRDSSAFPCR